MIAVAFLLFVTFAFGNGLQLAQTEGIHPEDTCTKSSEMATLSNAFALDLYSRLAKTPGNLFFSPFSVQTALAMAQAGARGKTAEEMSTVLGLTSSESHAQLGGLMTQLNADGEEGGYELAVANALWGLTGHPFLEEYLNLVEKEYAGKLSELDFVNQPEASRVTINDWVAKKTHERIKDLLPRGSINGLTRLILTNAIYFKGRWDSPFKKHNTKEEDFTLATGEKTKAQFMHQHEKFRYAEDESMQLLELTYGRNDLSMRVYLPRTFDGLGSLETTLTASKVDALSKELRRREVRVWLPQFTMESEFSLPGVLKEMGMTLAFTKESDFSGMSKAEQLFISDVIHKAFVKVDEEGTEAAAATAVMFRAMGCMVKEPVIPKEFKANRPFVFQIVHQQSNSILFCGRVVSP